MMLVFGQWIQIKYAISFFTTGYISPIFFVEFLYLYQRSIVSHWFFYWKLCAFQPEADQPWADLVIPVVEKDIAPWR